MVLISDHNTIAGYEKLNKALEYIHNKGNKHEYPNLICGVEISCADKNHIVGIFPPDTQSDKITEYLDEILINEVDGTYKTSLEVIKELLELDAISYIAHANTSDMFKDGKFLSVAYKKELFKLPSLNVIGLSNPEQKEHIEELIHGYTKNEFFYVLDCDSHAINTINKNLFWIKGKKCDFQTIQLAIADGDICIRFEKPVRPKYYIKGIMAKYASQAFLRGKDKDKPDFSLVFSEALNCFIGGRGTGKSTVINMIEAALSQRFISKEILNAIHEYPEIWLLYELNRKEYLVSFLSFEKEDSEESFMSVYDKWIHGKKRNNAFDETLIQSIRTVTLNKCIHIYEILEKQNSKIYCEEYKRMEDKNEILNRFFAQSYSVNELVQTASQSEKINAYILDTMQLGFASLHDNYPKFKSENGLKSFLCNAGDLQDCHKAKINKIIQQFNDSQEGKLRIVYRYDTRKKNFMPFERFLAYSRGSNTVIDGIEYYKHYNITFDSIVDFLYECSDILMVHNFFYMILCRQYKKIILRCPLMVYCENLTPKMIDNNIKEVTAEDQEEILSNICDNLIKVYKNEIIKYFRDDFIRYGDSFSLEFNIANKEGNQGRQVNFKDIKLLSLGQKVVAMLSFILGYSDYSKDYRPLVIDQPEDNLDSQYVYKNLVGDLRSIKNKRQVIIATHNATIVTNAKADQVIVMESDGNNGWVLACGYPNEKRIKRHIINYLEGGVDSFKHKQVIYKEIIGDISC